MVKAHPVNGPHTAGIFADMSIDGPEIGTLVLIVDRAKNLPNRKTIGKQNPYCAARLGKEAKKTITDQRGGQTPKWDQELRFTVHDSPDYYQLKVSVFNDDKKTELIGETWIDLRDIIIPGGGQNDLWQSLACKGKYAGEIRIEITFYDSRPKPEKPAAKPKPVHSDSDSFAAQHQVPKRRPLPSDPYTGQPPAQPQPPQPTQSHASTSPRALPTGPQPLPSAVSTSSHGSGRSHRHRHPDQHQHQHQHPSPPGSTYQPPPPRAESSSRGSLDRDRYSIYQEDASLPPDHLGHSPDRRYASSNSYAASPVEAAFHNELVDDRPPPPPVHRSTPTQTPPIMRKDVLRNEAHRQSVPANAYPGRPVYRAHESVPTLSSGHELYHGAAQQYAQPRHHSYDVSCEAHHRSLQPTVEDVPDSPGSGVDDFRRSGSYQSSYSEIDRRQDPSPAPLNLSGRNNNVDIHQQHASQRQNPSPDHMQAELFLPSSEYTASNASQSTYDAYSANSYAPYRQPSELDSAQRYELPNVPAPLIPGVDPSLSMEISQRLNDDRRHERRHTQPALPSSAVSSIRGRQMIEPPPSYSVPPPETSHPFSAPQHSYDNYDRIAVLYQPQHAAVRDRSPGYAAMRDRSPGISPSGHHTIKRKSVSPAPPLNDGRRLSGVPFGPDSYDALNPSVATPLPKDQVRQEKEYDEIEGKIITHDGKEIDPSDHLPMDTWAPEPEPKGKKPLGTATSRTSLAGPQPIPSSGRKPLRIREARPSSMALPPATYITPEVTASQLPPPSTGRNRLQKKANRSSAVPVIMSGANGPGGSPSPLAPLSQPHDNFVPRPLGRASTLDYENYAPPPMYDTTAMTLHGGGRDHSASAPPIPAKIPLNSGHSGAMVPMGRADYGGEMTLMEEMSMIDIGTGRARRHAHRSTVGGY